MSKIRSYAKKRNDTYSKGASLIFSTSKRWASAFASLPKLTKDVLKVKHDNSRVSFAKANPTIKKWSDLKLAEPKRVMMSDVFIDSSMQRPLNIEWVLDIMTKFKENMLIPIQVYADAKNPGKYFAWDGQHSLMVLWIIASHLGEDPSKCEIPVNVFHCTSKAEVRENFVALNSKEGKKALDLIDLWMQQSMGAQIDKNKNPLWIETNERQLGLAKYNLFVTDKKFEDDEQPGATTNVQALAKMSPVAVENMAHYIDLVMSTVPTGRPCYGKEIMLLGEYFQRCKVNKIKVDDKYVKDLAVTMLTLCSGDLSAEGPFWSQVAIAYKNWNPDSTVDPKTVTPGMEFLLKQLQIPFAQKYKHEIPTPKKSTGFVPADQDLL
jgi:hypothetical protein